MKLVGAIAAIAVTLGAATTAQAQTDPYFLWMNAVTDDTLTPRMAAHLHAAGVHGREQEQVAMILKDWKDAEASLEATDGDSAGTTGEFYAKQAALVQSTIAKLQLVPSFKCLDERVQHEATNIQVAKVTSHPMLHNAAFHPQLPPQMNPNYSMYTTAAVGVNVATLTASMLTNPNNGGTSFPQWNAANLVDGSTSDVGFATDGVPGGGETGVWVDFGANPQDIMVWPLNMSAANYSGHFAIYYSDGPSYTNVVPDFAPTNQGWNYATWPDAGAHRFWIMNLEVAGSGATVNEMQLWGTGAILYYTTSLIGSTSCPHGCNNVTHHGSVTNNLGPTKSGPEISPTSYMHVDNHQSLVLPNPDPGSPTKVGGGGTVYCTVAGILQSIPIIWQKVQIEIANTTSNLNPSTRYWNGTTHVYSPTTFCSGSWAPDFPGPNIVFGNEPFGSTIDDFSAAFIRTQDLGWRLAAWGTDFTGLPWQWLNLPRTFIGNSATPYLDMKIANGSGICTRKDPPSADPAF